MFVNYVIDDNGNLLEYKAFLDKYNLNCTYREYNKICKAIPIPLLQLVQSTLLYVRIRPLPNVFINDCTLFDSKCNNTYISDALKSKYVFDNRALCTGSEYGCIVHLLNLLNGPFPQKSRRHTLK